jgi:FAD/FMN-containing dehydrogenase
MKRRRADLGRRRFLQLAAAMPLSSIARPEGWSPSGSRRTSDSGAARRVRPGDAAWPSAEQWERLSRDVGGRLIKLESPLGELRAATDDRSRSQLLGRLKNAYYIGDQPALTQTSGWVDAWTAARSAYAVAARTTADVVAAVTFAREHNLRLVVKGGGHSYQGTSNAPDSLLIWTRAMNRITLHDAFVAEGADAQVPEPAVTVGAGAIWMHVYDAVTTPGGRYVQGGGCATVGVAGLIQSGGFGSFSKGYGLAAAGLLEAEVVTADGVVRIANSCRNPDLFWGLKGGGGGSLGVVTRLTLRTRPLPEFFGAVFGRIRASSDPAFRRLIARLLAFYREHLFNPSWGEQIVFQPANAVKIAMVFQDRDRAEAVWRPFLEWASAARDDFSFEEPLSVVGVPARRFWDAEFLRQNAPAFVVVDDRPGAPVGNVFWAADQGEAGQVLHGYRSAWLPVALLEESRQARLAEALFAASRHWSVALHFNKGLAGASAEDVAAARDTAIHPGALEAFALAIVAGGGPPAFPGIPGHEPDLAAGRRDRRRIDEAMRELLKAAPGAGSYVSESDFFEPSWQNSHWGANYPRLAVVKRKYDPAGLFFVHHGAGSEEWSPDGFIRVASPRSPEGPGP